MYKLIIIDDEPAVRRELSAFPWNELGIELIATFDNAVSAFKKIIDCSADIVITDIKMPVVNGLQLIEQVKKIRRNTVFVILSGFAEYEYMREAINLEITDYILKPIDFDDIRTAVTKITDKLKAQSKSLSYNEKRMEHLKASIERYRCKFYSKLFNESVDAEELSEKCDLCEINLTECPIDLCLFKYDRLSNSSVLQSFSYTDILWYIQKRVSLYLEMQNKGFAFYDGVSEFIAVALVPETASSEECRAVIDEIRENIKRLGTVFWDTISVVYTKGIDLPTEMHQYIKQMKAHFAQDMKEETVECECNIMKPNLADEAFVEHETVNYNIIAENMIAYIKKNFQKQIRLSDVAKAVFISPNYASSIFKTVTGKHFIDYLITVRMDYAKDMLIKTDTSVSQIGEAVGYVDPSYFCQVFKREVGVSPKQYRAGRP